MGYFLGIDLGTSYFKTGIFDKKGRLCGLGRQPVRKNSSNGITCELPVSTFWDTLKNGIAEALHSANIKPSEIRSVSYSSQANSFILLDGSDEPLTPIILWPDKRAAETEIPFKYPEEVEFTETTGLGVKPDADFMLAKLSWVQQNEPGIWKRTRNIMTISDYLTFSLTGEKTGDYSTASLTGLLDVREYHWWERPLELFHLDPTCLSIPLRTGTLAGTLSGQKAKYIGLNKGTPFFLGCLDHHAVAIGAGLPFSGNISESTGTVLACANYQKGYFPLEQVIVSPGLDEGHYFQMAFNTNGASALEWYQQQYAPGFTIPQLLEMAALVTIGSDGLHALPGADKFPGHSGFKNRQESHQHAHFVRAILESTAFSLVNILNILPGAGYAEGIISTGGGAKSRLWVEIKSNMLGKRFFMPECNETACLGAAMLGAAGTGEQGNIHEIIKEWVRFKEVVLPEAGKTDQYKIWQIKNSNKNR